MTNRFWLPALLLVVCAHNGRSDGGVARVRKVRTWQTATPLIGLAWSPDGQKIATASDFGRTLAVWTVDGKREAEFARHLNNGSYLHNSLAFLDGGKLLLTPPEAGTEKRALSIWDIAQGKVIRDVPGPFPAKHFRFNEAQFFAVSTDGSVVAVVSSVVLSEPVTVYSTRTWSVVDRIAMDAGPSKPSTATAIAFSPDGKRLAIGQLDGTIKIHGVGGTNSEMATVAAYDPRMLARIESLSFSPDGKYLVSGLGLVLDAYKSLPAVKLWRLGDLSMVGAYLPGAMPVREISWSPDGNFVALAAGDSTVRIGSPVGHEKSEWISFRCAAPVMSVAFSPARDMMAVASGSIVSVFEVAP